MKPSIFNIIYHLQPNDNIKLMIQQCSWDINHILISKHINPTYLMYFIDTYEIDLKNATHNSGNRHKGAILTIYYTWRAGRRANRQHPC